MDLGGPDNQQETYMDYYLEWDCPSCDETNYYGPCRTLISHNDLPVILLGEGEQQTYECEQCGKKTYTGEMTVLTEDEV